MMAAANGEPAARRFLKSLAGRHPRLLLRLISAAQSGGQLVPGKPLQLMCFLMASTGLPMLLAGAWSGPPLFGRALSATLSHIARDRDCIEQRLDWALLGLTPQDHP
jgi:hypothetical protein